MSNYHGSSYLTVDIVSRYTACGLNRLTKLKLKIIAIYFTGVFFFSFKLQGFFLIQDRPVSLSETRVGIAWLGVVSVRLIWADLGLLRGKRERVGCVGVWPGGGHSGTRWIPTAKRPRVVQAVNTQKFGVVSLF